MKTFLNIIGSGDKRGDGMIEKMNKKAFKKLFLETYSPCIKQLLVVISEKHRAEEVFVDAIVQFWMCNFPNSMKDTAYAVDEICRLALTDWNTKQEKKERYIEEPMNGWKDDSFEQLFYSLDTEWQDLLKATIVYKMNLKELQTELGFSSTEKIRAMRNRCKQQFLEQYIKELIC